MIDIQYIRTGKQVLHNASGSSVTILKIESNKVLLGTFPESSYWSLADVSGIPLTTRMLEKLSFTNDEQYDTWRGQGLGIDIKPDGFFYGLRISKSRTKIQYLHQLQNYIADFYSIFRQQKHSLNLSMLVNITV
jgi:hypothetical protein